MRRVKYNGQLFMGDLFGGAIAALIALPYGLAMASLMGLPPILGLYTSLLAAQAGVTVFHVAFASWVQQDDPTIFRRLMDESLQELRSVIAI